MVDHLKSNNALTTNEEFARQSLIESSITGRYSSELDRLDNEIEYAESRLAMLRQERADLED